MFTWVEIDKRALNKNISEFREIIGPKRLLMPVIKANAYGHGFLAVAKICAKNALVDRLCVVNSVEAMRLVEAGIKKPVMILSFFEEDKKILLKLARPSLRLRPGAAKTQVIFPLFSLKQAKILNQIGERLNKKIIIHLKLDTGASRVGILLNELPAFAKQIKKYKFLNIEGIFSHFSSSETDREETEKQEKEFNRGVKILETLGIKPALKHMSCTAASLLFSLRDFSAIRLGLGLYGLYPSASSRAKIKLQPVLSWRTKIIQIKNIPAGAKIGYGGTFRASKEMRLAILPVGYFDGYDRKLSNNSQVLINGQKCPVVGRICMNLMMVDASRAPRARAGDIATLIGKDKMAIITADELASRSGTINYEIVSRINPLLPRLVR